jgi:hypothetical protein
MAIPIVALSACGLGVVGSAERGATEPSEDATAPSLPPPGEEDAGLPRDAAVDVDVDADADAGPPLEPRLYVSSNDALWELHPITHVFTKVADWTSCGAGVEEIAIDRDEVVVVTGILNDTLYETTIGADAATCSPPVTAPMPFALSFGPTPDGGPERLVGYGGGTGNYGSVDRASGEWTVITPVALGTYRPSGDVVIGGGKGYVSATSNVVDECAPGDCLIEIDPLTGAFVKKLGDFPVNAIYGIAYWGGKVFGFANDGDTYVVTPEPFEVVRLPPPEAGIQWQGAGSRTDAPGP